MAIKVFITGVTGYVGGTVLTDLTKTNPGSLALTVLVRTQAQATTINEVHPRVTTLVGDFNSHELLVSAASEADVVLHIAGDFENGIFSLLEGVGKHPPGKRIFIHTTGSANLIDPKLPLGLNAPKRYSDVSDYAEIMAFPDERWHIPLEHKLIKTSIDKDIKTVILAPAQIYGRGSGTGSISTHSSEYARQVLKRGRGFLLGNGSNAWSGSSVGDVSSAIIFVLEETFQELWKHGGGKIEYGWNGYYFIEAGECSMRERAEIILPYLKELGAIESVEIDELSTEEVDKMSPIASVIFGTSSRSKADRLLALGWKPRDDWRSKMKEAAKADFLASKTDPTVLESKVASTHTQITDRYGVTPTNE